MTYDPRAGQQPDLSGLATKNELNQKANASTVGGLSTALNSKASQSDLDALGGAVAGKASQSALETVAASIPAAASAMPPPVADASAQGSMVRYAREDHTHASKARKAKVQAITTATYTWVYPTPFAAGVVPVICAIAQTAGVTTDLFNVQLEGAPNNTQCVLRINRVSSGLLSLLLGALAINPTPASISLHLIALEP